MFDFVADERNVYDPRVVRSEKLTDGPIGLGTRFRSVSRSGRRTIIMTIELTEYERPRRLASTTSLASMDIHSTLVFEPVREGTRLRWSSRIEPRGRLDLLRPVLGAIGRREATRIYLALKGALEKPHALPPRGDAKRPPRGSPRAVRRDPPGRG